MAIVLAEYAPVPIEPLHVVKLLLLHDLIEIDAGDTFCYDMAANATKTEREQQAADRLFGLLPADQAIEFRALWDEFEAQTTPASQFAACLDRLQPLLNNYQTQGHTWRLHQVCRDQVQHRMAPLQAIPELWDLVEQVLTESVAAGYLTSNPSG